MARLYFSETVESTSRVQVGEFSEDLPSNDAEFLVSVLSALAVAALEAVPTDALLVCRCARRAARRTARALEPVVGDRARVVSAGGRVKETLGIGSVLIVVAPIAVKELARVIELCWEHSPIAVGFVASRAPSIDDDTDWMDSTATPDAQFVARWHSLAVSFFHGTWIGFYAPSLSLPQIEQTVLESARRHGSELEKQSGPL